jgi:hypothetical protein
VTAESQVRHFDLIEYVEETGNGALEIATAVDRHALHGAWSGL